MGRCLYGLLQLGFWNFVGGEMTLLTFGKYKGWSVADVLDVNPSWGCGSNVGLCNSHKNRTATALEEIRVECLFQNGERWI